MASAHEEELLNEHFGSQTLDLSGDEDDQSTELDGAYWNANNLRARIQLDCHCVP